MKFYLFTIFFFALSYNTVFAEETGVTDEGEQTATESKETFFEFSPNQIEAIFGAKQSTIILFRKEEDAEAGYMKVLAEASKELESRGWLFVHASFKDQLQNNLAGFLNIDPHDLPTLRAMVPSKMKKFKSETKAEDLTVVKIEEFITSIEDGTLKSIIKSANPPAEQGNVLEVVGNTFDEIVLDKTKDVLIAFYQPMNSDCTKLLGIWKELGDFYQNESNVVIAQMDVSANEADGLDIIVIPQVNFYPRSQDGGKKAQKTVPFEASRDDLVSFFKTWVDENSPKAIKEEL